MVAVASVGIHLPEVHWGRGRLRGAGGGDLGGSSEDVKALKSCR